MPGRVVETENRVASVPGRTSQVIDQEVVAQKPSIEPIAKNRIEALFGS